MCRQLTIRGPNNIFKTATKSARPHDDVENRKHERRLEHDIYHLIIVDFARIFRLFVTNLDCLRSTSSTSSISHQLSLNASVHGTEQESCTVDCLGYSQMAMILENHAFGVSQSVGDVFALFGIKCDTAESGVCSMIVIESAEQIRTDF